MQSGRRIVSFANQGGDVGVGQRGDVGVGQGDVGVGQGGDVGVGQGGDVGVGQGDVGVEQGDVSTGQRDNTNTRHGVDTTIRHKVGRVVPVNDET